MSILKSQNGKYVVFSQNINIIRMYKETPPTFGRQGILDKEYIYSVQVSCDGYNFIDMANYKTEYEATTVMDATIDHIKKDEDYNFPMEVRFEEDSK